MRHRGRLLLLGTLALAGVAGGTQIAVGQRASSGAVLAVNDPPRWAFPVRTGPASPAPADDGTSQSVPGSSKKMTRAQIRDLFSVPDWHPDDHPPMPPVVANGRKPSVQACGYCHMPNGRGHPINAPLAGQPKAYLVQQVLDYKNGRRKGSEPQSPNTMMIALAKAATDAEIDEAAEYFSSLPLNPYIKVVEAATVPRTRYGAGAFYLLSDGGTEPIGQRLIETAEDLTRFELRDARETFVAYVPPGSIKKGETLVTTGGGKTVRCAICHGDDLRGIGPIPGLAGRSPTYMARQLYDIKHGVRAGTWSALMKETVVNLTEDDMMSIVAYTASRTP